MRTFLSFIFVLLLSLSLQSQDEFSIGTSIAYTFDGYNPNGNIDINFIGQSNNVIVPVGIITDTHKLGAGWGFRTGIGYQYNPDLTLSASFNFIDLERPHRDVSYGFNASYRIYDNYSIVIGTETIRGIRIGLMWKQAEQ